MVKLMSFAAVCLLLHLSACSLIGRDADIDADSKLRREKRAIGAFTTAMITTGISAGTSLAGTSVSAIMAPAYTVAVSGSVENYSKWPMIFQYCESAAGQINKNMINVDPGKKEGFASHKTGHTAKGTWVYCLYKVNNIRVHIMYSAPYDFNLHSNWLALAVTASSVTLNADKMYNKRYNYMARREYYYSVRPTELCQVGFCIKGTMGTSHRPIVTIKFYPRSFDNICPSVRKSLKDMDVKDANQAYKKFIDDEF